MSRNRNNNLSKTLKDYAVPFVGLLLILILLYSVFSWNNVENTDKSVNDSTILEYSEAQIILEDKDVIAYITYENWKKVKIEDSISIWKSEKVSVESWEVVIDFPFIAKFKLSKNWEFSYKEDWVFYLESANLWVEAIKDIDISMKYANVSLWVWSISNLNQNEIESTIYSIDWDVSISNLSWISGQVNNWYKVSIKSIESVSNDFDIDSNNKIIDDNFKLLDWFKSNGWKELLNKNSDDKDDKGVMSWSLLKKSGQLLIKDTSSLLTFDDIIDESYVNSNPIDLKWRYSPTRVSQILINGKIVSLNKELGIFSLKWFVLNSKTNDLIIKIFDENKNIIWKRILTIYSNKSIIKNDTLNSGTVESLENYQVKPTDFIVYKPTKTWKLTTSSSRVTIRWKVLNKNIKNVLVNDYSLKSYNGSTWRYHAFIEQGTLKDWANIYTIKYLDKDSKVVYKEYYSIYKEKVKIVVSEIEKETKIISSEVKVN